MRPLRELRCLLETTERMDKALTELEAGYQAMVVAVEGYCRANDIVDLVVAHRQLYYELKEQFQDALQTRMPTGWISSILKHGCSRYRDQQKGWNPVPLTLMANKSVLRPIFTEDFSFVRVTTHRGRIQMPVMTAQGPLFEVMDQEIYAARLHKEEGRWFATLLYRPETIIKPKRPPRERYAQASAPPVNPYAEMLATTRRWSQGEKPADMAAIEQMEREGGFELPPVPIFRINEAHAVRAASDARLQMRAEKARVRAQKNRDRKKAEKGATK